MKSVTRSAPFVLVVLAGLSCRSPAPQERQGRLQDDGRTSISQLISRLASHRRGEADRAADALVEIGEAAVPSLMKALKDPASEIRAYAAWLLVKIGRVPEIEPVAEALKDEDTYVRANAALALACVALHRRPDKTITAPLVAAMKDSEPVVRAAAAESLGYTAEAADESVVRVLIDALDDEDQEVILCAAWALGEVRSPTAVPRLIGLLKHTNWRVRETAAESLGWTGDAAAVAPLIETVEKDRNWNVRLCATWSLGHIADRRAIPVLIRTLKDENRRIAAKAAKSLSKITGRNFGTDHERWLDWYRRRTKK